MAFSDPLALRQVAATKGENPATEQQEVLVRAINQVSEPTVPPGGVYATSVAQWQETRIWLTLADAAALRDKLTALLGT